MRTFLYLAIVVAALSHQCTIFKKSIKKPVTVYFNKQLVLPNFSNSGSVIKYLHNNPAEDIAKGFMDNFLQEGGATPNITLVDDPQKADFTLEIISLDITEKSGSQTINDSKSPYNGQNVMLNSVDCSASVRVINNKHPEKKLMTCNNVKSRSEKLKNNRDVGDLITGTNKDHTEYRTKLMRDEICLDLAKDVGRRVWVPITRRIAHNM